MPYASANSAGDSSGPPNHPVTTERVPATDRRTKHRRLQTEAGFSPSLGPARDGPVGRVVSSSVKERQPPLLNAECETHSCLEEADRPSGSNMSLSLILHYGNLLCTRLCYFAKRSCFFFLSMGMEIKCIVCNSSVVEGCRRLVQWLPGMKTIYAPRGTLLPIAVRIHSQVQV